MTVEQQFDSNFRYVMVAARRARQLQSGSPALVSSHSGKPCRVAQDEIAAGKIGYIKGETPVVKPEVASPDVPKFAIF